jgi:molybdate transport system substrate-binding protein
VRAPAAKAGLTALLALALTACTARTGAVVPVSASGDVELTVFGAASLRDALERAEADYERARPGTTLTIATDSSAALRTQIEQGAPADVFLSADTTNPQRLVEDGFALGAPVPFAANELTVIVPTGNPAGLDAASDLAADGVEVIAAGQEVPITRYATEVVTALGIADGYEANVVSREDNVKAVVTKIALGEGDAALVYATDAAASEAVETIDIPDEANVTATYAGVVVATSRHPAEARAFLDWMAEGGGREVVRGLGFVPAAQ